MVSIDPSFFIPHADGDTSPIHHHDVCCEEENDGCEDEPDHADSCNQ